MARNPVKEHKDCLRQLPPNVRFEARLLSPKGCVFHLYLGTERITVRLTHNFPFEPPRASQWSPKIPSWKPTFTLSLFVWWILAEFLHIDNPGFHVPWIAFLVCKRTALDHPLHMYDLSIRWPAETLLHPELLRPASFYFEQRAEMRRDQLADLAERYPSVPTVRKYQALHYKGPDAVPICVKHLDGQKYLRTVDPSWRVEVLRRAEEAFMDVPNVRMIYAGQPLSDDQIFAELPNFRNHAVFHVIVPQRGDIGHFVLPAQWWPAQLDQVSMVRSLVKSIKQPDSPFCNLPRVEANVVDDTTCDKLVHVLDENTSSTQDFQMLLGLQQLIEIMGPESVSALVGRFGTFPSKIVLRRVTKLGHGIPFHVDESLLTMQIVLTAGHHGGDLVFLLDDGTVLCPPRIVGSCFLHDNTVVHGVSALLAKVPRDSLFFLKKT